MKFTLLNKIQIYNFFNSLKNLKVDIFIWQIALQLHTVGLSNICEYLIKKKLTLKNLVSCT